MKSTKEYKEQSEWKKLNFPTEFITKHKITGLIFKQIRFSCLHKAETNEIAKNFLKQILTKYPNMVFW